MTVKAVLEPERRTAAVRTGVAMDYTIKIGGEAGQGVQTVGETLSLVFARSGYHVFSHQDYESRVRGGHNFYQIRFSDRPVSASRMKAGVSSRGSPTPKSTSGRPSASAEAFRRSSSSNGYRSMERSCHRTAWRSTTRLH